MSGIKQKWWQECINLYIAIDQVHNKIRTRSRPFKPLYLFYPTVRSRLILRGNGLKGYVKKAGTGY